MKRRGISIISLSVMVVVILIILSVVSVTLTYSINNAKKLAFAEEIYNIQSIVDEHVKREGVLPEVTTTITITPNNIEQFSGEKYINGSINLDVLDLTKIDIKNTEYGNKTIGKNASEKEKDVYAVSETTGKVYYIAGLKIGSETYYTLTEELIQMVEKEQNITIGEKTITFRPSKIGWANEGTSVSVIVPVEYTSPSITISNSKIQYTETSDVNGKKYVVNSEKVYEDYTITVSYIKNGIAETATYTTKLDNVAPVISKDENIANTDTHVKGIKATDDKSGIKYFKYAQGLIDLEDAKAYMNKYGKNIESDSIKFSNKVVYTLYAEDKAGNYSVMYIDEYGKLVSKVETRCVSIKITKAPTKTSYNHGDAFDKTGMEVTATYNIGSKKKVTNYTIPDGDSLVTDQESVTISYTENGITKTTTQKIKVTKLLTEINVTTAATKTTYNHGDAFDKTGMVVTATYNDGSTEDITDYKVTNGSSLTDGQTSVTISYTKNGVTKTTTQAIKVTKVLLSIKVTTAPNKTSYNHGDSFSKTGMVVTATYNNDTTSTITNYTITNGSSLTTSQTSVTISYTENGVTKTTTQTISVTRVLSSIRVTTAPNKTSYNHGNAFDKTGMVITATYNDGTTAKVTNYTITNGSSLTAGQSSVTISYTENGVTKTITQSISVIRTLSSIRVTTAPSKTSYGHGESFNTSGMIVTATYNDGSTSSVIGYSVTNGSNLTAGQTSVTISYTENNVTKTTTQSISVTRVLSSISVTTAPNKISYYVGESFNKTGMVVKATYNNGTTANITNYTITNGTNLTKGQSSITISYTDNGVTKATTQSIKVTETPPMLANRRDWYDGDSTEIMYISQINIVPEADEETIANAIDSWPAAADLDGDNKNDSDIMCYANDDYKTITIAGNGADKINANTLCLFYGFDSLIEINGIEMLDTSNITDMNSMFEECANLVSLDLSNFDTSNVTDMRYMFNGCHKLTSLDVTSFDTRNVTTMFYMFNGCKSLKTLDVSSFDTSKVENVRYMFSNCTELTTIYASELFDVTHVDPSFEGAQMFYKSENLVGGNGTAFDSIKMTSIQAVIDTPETPGYFTAKTAVSAVSEEPVSLFSRFSLGRLFGL